MWQQLKNNFCWTFPVAMGGNALIFLVPKADYYANTIDYLYSGSLRGEVISNHDTGCTGHACSSLYLTIKHVN